MLLLWSYHPEVVGESSRLLEATPPPTLVFIVQLLLGSRGSAEPLRWEFRVITQENSLKDKAKKMRNKTPTTTIVANTAQAPAAARNTTRVPAEQPDLRF